METPHCSICLDVVTEKNNIFKCNHNEFHKTCIKNLSTCPLCRAELKEGQNSILIWNENNRFPAEIFRNTRNLNMPIRVIKSMDEYKVGDIVYHHVSGS